ncbi:sarcosine oxidase subunit gamma family protein [Breoghania sp.]|uniref:sarcosine oxidase subunit gamma n=1 Tax=Breoghania sp. TaxID=2065378 RepID=UPI002AA85DFC|nr:sarcosine oxidase subunit gamma family protein [Breoghania sp.]
MVDAATLPRAGAMNRLCGADAAALEAGPLTVREMPVPAQINLRGDPKDKAFLDAVEGTLGCPLPLEPNRSVTGEGITILWLGPDEWLVLGAPSAEDALVAKLRDALSAFHCAVTDVTGNRALFRLSGVPARLLLAKGCSLDLHPSVFGPGQCAQTLVVRAGVILHQVDDAPTFDLMPRRSFAEYLWGWLDDAMAEYR